MSNEDTTYPTILIEELRLQLQRHHEAYNSIMTKTNALLVVSGITMSIILGFFNTTFNIENIAMYQNWIFFTILCLVASIIIPLIIFIPRSIFYPIASSNYFDKDGYPLLDKIKERCQKNGGDPIVTVEDYFKSMKNIERENQRNSTLLLIGITAYISGISCLIFIVQYIQFWA